MDAKKKALRKISNGIYIITSGTGSKYGAGVVSWVSQVSFIPPLIMVAIRPKSGVFACLSESGQARLHILSTHQEEIARKFLARVRVKDGLMNREPYIQGTGSAPILTGIAASIECQLHGIIDDQGDHALVVLKVVDAEYSSDFKPLLVADTPWTYGG